MAKSRSQNHVAQPPSAVGTQKITAGGGCATWVRDDTRRVLKWALNRCPPSSHFALSWRAARLPDPRRLARFDGGKPNTATACRRITLCNPHLKGVTHVARVNSPEHKELHDRQAGLHHPWHHRWDYHSWIVIHRGLGMILRLFTDRSGGPMAGAVALRKPGGGIFNAMFEEASHVYRRGGQLRHVWCSGRQIPGGALPEAKCMATSKSPFTRETPPTSASKSK